jgi:aryl-alcohol dehydrogenase-like predicted oxidoreductase
MFHKSRSFNRHDSSYNGEGERHLINQSVATRCNLVMKFLREECKHFRKEGIANHRNASWSKMGDIIDYLLVQYPTYTRGDIVHALNKLVQEGFVEKNGMYYNLRHNPTEVTITFR